MAISLASRLFIIASEKGGVGKSMLALALADRLVIEGYPPSVIQVDRQRRLAAALGGDVLTIESNPKASRNDPELEHRRFSPVLERIEAVAGSNPIIVDIGAGEVGRFAAWSGLADLQEDLEEWGLHCTVVIPYLAEAEAIRQAAWSAERLRAVLPQAEMIFVENRRDGRVDQLHPNSTAAAAVVEHLNPWHHQSNTFAIPSIPGGSWRHFEAACSRFIDIVEMSPKDVMQRTGLPRAEAKIARGDVSQWLVKVFDEFDRAFCLQGA